jgi:DNA helicase-2/ATP-dependent DNA helicase PcrA
MSKNKSLGNPNQIAFCKAEGNTVVEAGPGTGKTYSIKLAVEYFFNIFSDIEENQCLAITFTNAAANELANRIDRLIDISTFHSFAREVIYLNDGFYPNVMDKAGSISVMKDIILTLNLDIKDQELYDNIKYNPNNNPEALQLYNQHKEQMFMLDFDDLLITATKYLNADLNLIGYYIIFVDETQDVSQLQLDLLYAMQRQWCGAVFKFVGDPNQSIMGFAGAVQNVMSILAKKFNAQTMQFNETFRSCVEVVNVYKDFAIKPVKNLITHNLKSGHVKTVVCYDDVEECKFIVNTIKGLPEGTTVGILTRTRPYLPKIEAALIAASIPCNNVGSISFYKYAEIALLMAWLKLYLNSFDTISGMKVITQLPKIGKKTGEKMLIQYKGNPALVPILNEPMQIIENAYKDGLDTKSILKIFLKKYDFWSMKTFNKDDEKVIATRKQRLNVFIDAGEGVKLHDFVYNILSTTEKTDSSQNVSLTTIHSAKGLEYDVVFVVGVEDGILPHFRSKTPYEIVQEFCLMFVALSRARYKMYITRSSNRFLFGQAKRMNKSMWWNDIIRDKVDIKAAKIENIDLNPDKAIGSWTCTCGVKNDIYEEVEDGVIVTCNNCNIWVTLCNL